MVIFALTVAGSAATILAQLAELFM